MKIEGKNINIGLVNNSAQSNVELTQNNNFNNKFQVKTGIFEYIKAAMGEKRIDKICNYQLKKIQWEKKLKESIEEIPEEFISSPRLNLLSNAIDNLKYSYDEDYLAKMFNNIITGELDTRKQKNVLPSFGSVVSQLSKIDADLLNFLAKWHVRQFSLCTITFEGIAEEIGHVYLELDNSIIINDNKNEVDYGVEKVTLENLERLGLIKITSNEVLPQQKEFIKKRFEEYVKNNTKFPNDLLVCHHNILYLTDYGKLFIDICCKSTND